MATLIFRNVYYDSRLYRKAEISLDTDHNELDYLFIIDLVSDRFPKNRMIVIQDVPDTETEILTVYRQLKAMLPKS